MATASFFVKALLQFSTPTRDPTSPALVQAKKFENANTDYGSGQECEDD
jgi:hypothetical protein